MKSPEKIIVVAIASCRRKLGDTHVTKR